MTEETQDRLLHDLKLIATLREGDKVYVQDGVLCVQHRGTITSVLRWARGDTRHKSIAVVQNTMLDALKLAEYNMEKLMRKSESSRRLEVNDIAQRSMVTRLYRELQNAAVGLRHMRITYIDDRNTAATLDVLRERVTERLSAIRRFVEESQSETPPLLRIHCVPALVRGESSNGDSPGSYPPDAPAPISADRPALAPLLDGFVVFDGYNSRILDVTEGAQM